MELVTIVSLKARDLTSLQFFKEHDCIILAEHTMAESCSEDGLIVVNRRDVIGPDEISIRKY